jgi:hypothetical protein
MLATDLDGTATYCANNCLAQKIPKTIENIEMQPNTFQHFPENDNAKTRHLHKLKSSGTKREANPKHSGQQRKPTQKCNRTYFCHLVTSKQTTIPARQSAVSPTETNKPDKYIGKQTSAT